MMSGAQYHISYIQILESQRRLNLSNILKLFSQQNKRDLSLTEESTEVSYDQYLDVILDLNSINLEMGKRKISYKQCRIMSYTNFGICPTYFLM